MFSLLMFMTITEMDHNANGTKSKKRIREICIPDSGTTHTILRQKRYFSDIKPKRIFVNTISGPVDVIEGAGKANFTLPNGTKFFINNALYSPSSKRNLLSFKDIYRQGYDTQSATENGKKYLYVTSEKYGILEKFPEVSSGLHHTYIDEIESNLVVKQNPEEFTLWHDRLGHPGTTMMRKIIESSHGHSLKIQEISQGNKMTCVACSLGKLIIRPSPTKVDKESPKFLERIQGDICGPIHPPCGPFHYFMVLIDASSRWSHVCLLSSRNVAFARFLTQIIKLRAQFPDYTIKRVRLDNAAEFTSQAFNDYCMVTGIEVEHSVAHVHTDRKSVV